MNYRALALRAYDLLKGFGAPPYSVLDHQAVHEWVSFYSLERALRVADQSGTTKLAGVVSKIWVGRTEYKFTVDRKGRRHLPVALRRRIL